MPTDAVKKPTVFISYSRKDKVWKDRLASQLGVLSEQGLLSYWDDSQIGVGEDWYEKIQEAMNAASRDFNRARNDLDEALSVAVRGSMGLSEADCHLGYARLYVVEGKKEKARESWTKAKEMIERMGYPRRDKDVAEIERQIEELPDK